STTTSPGGILSWTGDLMNLQSRGVLRQTDLPRTASVPCWSGSPVEQCDVGFHDVVWHSIGRQSRIMAAPPNPDPTEDKPLSAKRQIPLSLKRFIVINAVVALTGSVCFWYVILRPMQNHRRAYHRLSDSVRSLAQRRPSGVSRNQWSYIIGWT